MVGSLQGGGVGLRSQKDDRNDRLQSPEEWRCDKKTGIRTEGRGQKGGQAEILLNTGETQAGLRNSSSRGCRVERRKYSKDAGQKKKRGRKGLNGNVFARNYLQDSDPRDGDSSDREGIKEKRSRWRNRDERNKEGSGGSPMPTPINSGSHSGSKALKIWETDAASPVR